MRYAIVSVALLLAGIVTPAAAQDCSLKQMAQLAISGLPRHVVVEVAVAGKPRHFLVDTGGLYSEIAAPIVEELGLRKTAVAMEIYGMDGQQIKYGTTVPSLTIGNNELQNAHMLVMPGGQGIDGILAPDILQAFDVDFDMASKMLRLFSPDHCPGKVVYWATSYSTLPFKLADGFHITLPAEVDGHSLNTILDSGSSENWMTQAAARQIYSLDETSPGMTKLDSTIGGMAVYRKTFQSFALSDISVSYTTIFIRPPADMATFQKNHSDKAAMDPIYGSWLDTPQLIVGMDVLHKLHVYIAYHEHTLYLTSADGH